jgi:RES domain-containing protein
MVLPAERNVLINPEHPQMSRIRVLSPEPFVFDRRLLR